MSEAQNYLLAEKDYMSGMKYKEIAEKYGVSINTVKSWKVRYKWDKKGVHTKKKKVCIQKECENTEKEVIVEEVDHVMENPDLTDKQRLFCIFYVKSFNATKAYQKAYECSYETACGHAHELLKNVEIKKEIQSLKQNRLNREMLDESDIFQKYMDIAFADITDYIEFGVEDIPVMAMYGPVQIKDENTGEKKILTQKENVIRFKNSNMVDGTLISEVKQGKNGTSIKIADRMKALEWLTKHMDIATEEQRVRIAAIKAKLPGDDNETSDDGFLEALKGMVSEVWEE